MESPYDYFKILSFSNSCWIHDPFAATWVTEKNERVPEDPYYFCSNCYKEKDQLVVLGLT